MRPEPATAAEVMRACTRHWNVWKDHVIPRCCLAGWEADLLIIKPSGWAEEVEIKISASDFRAEWRKKARKHEDLFLGGCRWVGYIPREGEPPEHYLREPAALAHPKRVDRDGRIYIRDRPTLVRRFWFAMPKSLAEKLLPEVPAHYGVLAVGHWNEVLRAPTNLKPARKLTEAERSHALYSAYCRFWKMTLEEKGILQALSEPGLAATP